VVVSREDASIASELDGRLEWIAEVGDRFKRGEIIAQLDTHLIELEIRQREAQIAALEANLAWLERQTARLDELANANNTAHSELDETRARYLVLEQELEQARVGLQRTNYDLERAAVRAPFNGVVVSRDMAGGEYASVGRPLLRLVNPTAAEISVTAPLRLARHNHAGDIVQISNNQFTTTATVRSLVEVGDLRSHMMELRLTPQPTDWLIGEAITVELPASDREDQTTVSRDALVLRDRNNFVYVVNDESVAQRVPVELGAGEGGRIAVLGALEPGDRVIVRGAERLRDGQKVNPLNSQVGMR
jgi:RND family efflux transporter MFP subunit